jgi:hypothetical protein
MKLLRHVKCMEKQALCIRFCSELRLQTTDWDEWEDGIKVDLEKLLLTS